MAVSQFKVECEYSGRTETVCVLNLAPRRVSRTLTVAGSPEAVCNTSVRG
jgi:hypothetical protein